MNKIFKQAKSFNEAVLLNSFIELCKDKDDNIPFVIDLESLGFYYLKYYIIYFDERKRLSSELDETTFSSILNLKLKYNNLDINFNDYNTFLDNFKGEFKEDFIQVIENYILKTIKINLKNFQHLYKEKKFIIYDESFDEVGFPIKTIKVINIFRNEFKNDLKLTINNLNFEQIEIRPIYNSLEEILNIMYNDESMELPAMARIHLFGIAYNEELSIMSGREREELIINGTGKKSILTELNKGINLAKIVSINNLEKIPILRGSKYDSSLKDNK